jgi:hypothetical protein
VTKHKFSIGQRVQLSRGASKNQPYAERFTITRQMPIGQQGPMYRIKGDGETHERVAQESHLESVF